MNTQMAEAIVQMGEGAREYNRGVLAAMGMEKLAWAHNIAAERTMKVAKMREDAIDNPMQDSPFDAELEAAASAQRAAWQPIAALIAQAKTHLEGAADAAPAYGLHV